MDFELSQDQKMLADTVATFVKQSSPVDRFRELCGDVRGWDAKTWAQMGELGWLSVPFAEEVGGFGGSFVDVALVLEKLGTTLVPEPYLASVVLGGMALAEAGSPEQQARFLTPMIEGKSSLAFAYAERQSRYDAHDCRTVAERRGDRFLLSGEKTWVLNGHAADHLVVSAKLDGELRLFVVDRGAEGVSITPMRTIDGQRAAFVRLEGVEVGGERALTATDDAGATLDRVLDYAAAAACAEGLGVIDASLRMTLDYLNDREQFGVKIASFQVLQHRAVDMFIEAEMCRSMSMMASVKVHAPDEGERKRAISAAKAQLAVGGTFVVQQAIQLHGGIGITDEHDIGLYFKRMTALNALFGDEPFHVERFAGLPAFDQGIEGIEAHG